MENEDRTVTIFGGTGFLGRRMVRAFADDGFHVRIAARNPHAAELSKIGTRLGYAEVDILAHESVVAALEGASAAINAVSLYDETDDVGFDDIHVDGANRVARCCAEAGVESLVHVSGIGSAKDSRSALVRAKARGEDAVNEAFPDVTIFRPSVLFGRDDAFIRGIEAASRSPVVPLFGRGDTRLQPAWVRDVARGAVQAATQSDARGKLFELGGARVVTYREAVEAVCDALGRHRLLMPFPMLGWKILAWAMQALPNPPLNQHQLHLLAADNTASEDLPGFEALDIEPSSMYDKLEHCLK